MKQTLIKDNMCTYLGEDIDAVDIDKNYSFFSKYIKKQKILSLHNKGNITELEDYHSISIQSMM